MFCWNFLLWYKTEMFFYPQRHAWCCIQPIETVKAQLEFPLTKHLRTLFFIIFLNIFLVSGPSVFTWFYLPCLCHYKKQDLSFSLIFHLSLLTNDIGKKHLLFWFPSLLFFWLFVSFGVLCQYSDKTYPSFCHSSCYFWLGLTAFFQNPNPFPKMFL